MNTIQSHDDSYELVSCVIVTYKGNNKVAHLTCRDSGGLFSKSIALN